MGARRPGLSAVLGGRPASGPRPLTRAAAGGVGRARGTTGFQQVQVNLVITVVVG